MWIWDFVALRAFIKAYDASLGFHPSLERSQQLALRSPKLKNDPGQNLLLFSSVCVCT